MSVRHGRRALGGFVFSRAAPFGIVHRVCNLRLAAPARRPEDQRMREYSGLLTDLYELTMAAGYLQTRFDARATFELFVRHLPPQRNYLVAAGLEQALEFLENVNFTADEIDYLRRPSRFFGNIGPEFFDYLAKFHFTGDVWAMPEGTLMFPGRAADARDRADYRGADHGDISARDAQLSDHDREQSRARRHGGAGRRVVDFSARRAHGGEASLLAARAAAIGGCVGTSNVLAGQQFGLATYGTQAHSWVMAHEDEAEAFRHFLDAFPEGAVLLVDTYDVRDAVKKIIAMGRKPAGIRLDSGDLAKDSRWVAPRTGSRGMEGCEDFRIGRSGRIQDRKAARGRARPSMRLASGPALGTPGDAPHLNLIYKLVEVERDGKVREAAKFSHAKVTYPGRKQVFRHSECSGRIRKRQDRARKRGRQWWRALAR